MEGKTGNVIMLLLLEQLLVESHTRGHKFGDATLDYLLCKLRVFQLVTYRNLITGADEPRKISFK